MIKNADLIDLWISSEKSKKSTNILKKIKTILNIKECSDDVHKKLENVCKTYCLAVGRKWKDCSRNKNYLFRRHHVWLSKDIIPKDLLELVRHEPQPCSNRGRPAINFLDASLKTKRR